jgi:hypothetical protein
MNDIWSPINYLIFSNVSINLSINYRILNEKLKKSNNYRKFKFSKKCCNLYIKISKQKMCRVSARRFYNFTWGLLKASNLQAESEILKKLLEHEIYQSKQKISKKNCVSYFKSGKRPKICPDGICRPDPKS